MSDILTLNRQAWNRQSTDATSPWVQPVDSATIERARQGDWQVILTPNKVVPRTWFGDIRDQDMLGLASGGGQQVPTLAAAGARLTSFDNSDAQLAKDQLVATREGLNIRLEQGDMADLSRFDDACFDLIFHPTANVFSADILPVWLECFRVLRPRGRLLSGFMNPCFYLFDHEAIEAGAAMQVCFELPYADTDHLDEIALQARAEQGLGIEFGHSLDEQIGGQTAAGFVIAGFYEDRWSNEATPLNRYMPTSMATLALKMA
jgi:SAM-dependent methyltransferase